MLWNLSEPFKEREAVAEVTVAIVLFVCLFVYG